MGSSQNAQGCSPREILFRADYRTFGSFKGSVHISIATDAAPLGRGRRSGRDAVAVGYCVGVHSIPLEVARATYAYLRAADRFLPGGIIACAATGSLALGAYREGISDIDLVAVVDDSWRGRRTVIPRLRLLHLSRFPRVGARVVRGLGASATCNTSFIWASDAGRPVSAIRPVASHVGEQFVAGRSFDVNPVMWSELVGGGIALRGPEVSSWGLFPEPDAVAEWTRKNLRGYWLPLADGLDVRRRPLTPGNVAWLVCGPARMHATMTTCDIISKEEAGRRAREIFPQHTEIIDVALAARCGEKPPQAPPRREWRARTSAVMREILDDLGV